MNGEKEYFDDGAFYVKESRWKMWDSYDKNENIILTSLKKETCIQATRFYLKKKQQDWLESKAYS
jgi:hypothetical protein